MHLGDVQSFLMRSKYMKFNCCLGANNNRETNAFAPDVPNQIVACHPGEIVDLMMVIG